MGIVMAASPDKLPDNLPTPTWCDEEYGIALYDGDCLEILPTLPKVEAGVAHSVVSSMVIGIGIAIVLAGSCWLVGCILLYRRPVSVHLHGDCNSLHVRGSVNLPDLHDLGTLYAQGLDVEVKGDPNQERQS